MKLIWARFCLVAMRVATRQDRKEFIKLLKQFDKIPSSIPDRWMIKLINKLPSNSYGEAIGISLVQ